MDVTDSGEITTRHIRPFAEFLHEQRRGAGAVTIIRRRRGRPPRIPHQPHCPHCLERLKLRIGQTVADALTEHVQDRPLCRAANREAS